MYRKFFKRIIDIVLSLIGLVVLFPLLLLISILLLITNKGKILFIQARPGKDGRIFRILKFRTMKDLRDSNGTLLPDFQRITHFGNFLRKTSLDEIPQLLNVLKGEMSLIGPRPLLIEYLPLYNREQARRHEVRPGITGYTQTHGRNTISWEEKFNYDTWYVDHLSLILDAQIILSTIVQLFRTKEINASDTVTMEKFKGTPPINTDSL